MRWRVQFTTEPFNLDEASAHAPVARQVVDGPSRRTPEVAGTRIAFRGPVAGEVGK